MAKQEVDKLATQLTALVVAQGVFLILFGIAALFWPKATFAVMLSLYAVLVLIWGVIGLIRGFLTIGRSGTWWLELIFSLIAIGLGVYLLRNPAVAVGVFVLLVGFTLIIRGIIDFLQGVFGRDEDINTSRVLYIVAAIVGVLAGVLVLANPVTGTLAFVWVLGLYALIEGAILVGVGIRANNELNS